MLKIAVCAVNASEGIRIKAMILSYRMEHGYNFAVDVYGPHDDIKEIIGGEERYHIVFADTELPFFSRLEPESETHKLLKDMGDSLVIFSSDPSCITYLLTLQPFDFLLKPISSVRISECLDNFIKCNVNTDILITYNTKREKIYVAIDDIIYIQSNAAGSMLYTLDGSICCIYNYFDAIKNELREKMIAIDQDTAVNIDHIVRMDRQTILMSDGTRLNVSDNYINYFMNVYLA